MTRSFATHFSVATPEEELASASATSEQQVQRFKTLLLDEVDLQELSGLGLTERRIRLERILAHLISREGLILSTRERTGLIRTVVDDEEFDRLGVGGFVDDAVASLVEQARTGEEGTTARDALSLLYRLAKGPAA